MYIRFEWFVPKKFFFVPPWYNKCWYVWKIRRIVRSVSILAMLDAPSCLIHTSFFVKSLWIISHTCNVLKKFLSAIYCLSSHSWDISLNIKCTFLIDADFFESVYNIKSSISGEIMRRSHGLSTFRGKWTLDQYRLLQLYWADAQQCCRLVCIKYLTGHCLAVSIAKIFESVVNDTLLVDIRTCVNYS